MEFSFLKPFKSKPNPRHKPSTSTSHIYGGNTGTDSDNNTNSAVENAVENAVVEVLRQYYRWRVYCKYSVCICVCMCIYVYDIVCVYRCVNV